MSDTYYVVLTELGKPTATVVPSGDDERVALRTMDGIIGQLERDHGAHNVRVSGDGLIRGITLVGRHGAYRALTLRVGSPALGPLEARP